MAVMDLRNAAQREDALRTIRARLVGARYELEQALAESGAWLLGAKLAGKLDRALLEVDGALECDALKPK